MTTLSDLCNTLALWLAQSAADDPHWSADTWSRFKLISRVHGIAPALHVILNSSDWLDAEIKNWLAEQADLNAQRVAKMQGELAAILALLARHGLPAMPLKGSVLAARYYEDASLRPMADLDLLVRPQDFAHVGRLLTQLGYAQEVAHWKHTEFVKPDNRQAVSFEAEHPDNPRKVEVHRYCRESFGGPSIDLTEVMWAHSDEGTLWGERAIIPRPEALWLHLLVHHTYHAWQGKARLIQLVDLVKLAPHLSRPECLLDTVDARFVYPSLALWQRYFPNAEADALATAERGRVSAGFRQWVDGLDLVNTSHLNPNPPGLYLTKALKFSEGRPGEIGQALRFALLPAVEELALDHPRLAQSSVPWLAYALLPLDWLKRLRPTTDGRPPTAKP